MHLHSSSPANSLTQLFVPTGWGYLSMAHTGPFLQLGQCDLTLSQCCVGLLLPGAALTCTLPRACLQQLPVFCTAQSAACAVTLETAFPPLPTAVHQLSDGYCRKNSGFCLQQEKRPNALQTALIPLYKGAPGSAARVKSPHFLP